MTFVSTQQSAPPPRVPYGGDYSPEQWSESDWIEDIRCFKEAGITVATLGVFSWASIETKPGCFDFSWLDRAIKLLWEQGIHVCLATGTAAHPHWLSQAHPETLITTVDGRRMEHGRRINFCPNSPHYREAAANYVRRLAERYAHHPALMAWHIGNEYGHGARGSYCYCAQCAADFRVWLKEKYGTLEAVNAAWYTAFWGSLLSDWEQIQPPSLLNEQNPAGPSAFPGKTLDYRRFQSESHLACYRMEREILREANPKIPATTNLMGAYKDLDYWKWAPHLDFISWDCYEPIEQDPAGSAFGHDLMRSLKPEVPFWLMECSPGHETHRPRLRRPGGLHRLAFQALARGAGAVLYFQLRQSKGACEKFHSAVVQQGRRTDTRTFEACADLGRQLQGEIPAQLQGHPQSDTAVFFDWETWWAYDLCAITVTELNYLQQARLFHSALYDLNIVPNFVGIETSLENYRTVILPLCYAFPEKLAPKLEAFVREGGTLIMGPFGGRADPNDQLWDAPAPGPLGPLFGVRLEEFEAVDADEPVYLKAQPSSGIDGGTIAARRIVELLKVEADDVEILASFQGGIADRQPAVTRRKFGKGTAIYMATSVDRADLKALLSECLPQVPAQSPDMLERVDRGRDADGRYRELLLNHSPDAIEVGQLPPPAPGWRLSLSDGERANAKRLEAAELRLLYWESAN